MIKEDRISNHGLVHLGYIGKTYRKVIPKKQLIKFKLRNLNLIFLDLITIENTFFHLD